MNAPTTSSPQPSSQRMPSLLCLLIFLAIDPAFFVVASNDAVVAANEEVTALRKPVSMKRKKNDIEGNYFAPYKLYLGFGDAAIDFIFFFRIDKIQNANDLMYKFNQCYLGSEGPDENGNLPFTRTGTGTLVLTENEEFHVNMIPRTNPIDDGCAFHGLVEHKEKGPGPVTRISLLDFYDDVGCRFYDVPSSIRS